MSQLGSRLRTVPHIALILGAALALVASQIVFSLLSSRPSATTAEAKGLEALAQPVSPVALSRPASPMNAALPTGQFEELVKPTPVPTIAPPAVPAPSPPTPDPTPTATLLETGVASTYGEGDGFEGRLTACGQVFHTSVVQVAHKSLPCGTLIRIEDSDTGRAVTARVTDRGPYIVGRIVDLSWGAFEELDPSGPGLLHVNVYIVDP